jgi:hypothetical protein
MKRLISAQHNRAWRSRQVRTFMAQLMLAFSARERSTSDLIFARVAHIQRALPSDPSRVPHRTISQIPGGVTAAQGFQAGSIYCGI